jgi:hypothetical protein
MEFLAGRDHEASVELLERIFPIDQLNDGVMSDMVIQHTDSHGHCNCERDPETIIVE